MLDISESTLDKIESQFSSDGERKMEVFSVCATKNPELTWEKVSDALYRTRDEQCHKTLGVLQSRFPTGESLSHSPHSPTLRPLSLF